MSFSATQVPYSKTGSFSALVLDYLSGAEALKPFYTWQPSLTNLPALIKERKRFSVDRKTLVDTLRGQYREVQNKEIVLQNIDKLLSENCFSICTAHQPNIFTGHLYFVYKILHAIRLAEAMKESEPSSDFVPVYYMGSEDADLEELGEIELYGRKFIWETKQKGAVGRMEIDAPFIKLIDEIEAALGVEPGGHEIISLVKKHYLKGRDIQTATLHFVHELFGQHGLIVLIADVPALKKSFVPFVKKELSENFSSKIVSETIADFPASYKVQTTGREINLFYLEGDSRERIFENGNGFSIANSSRIFTANEMAEEIDAHPETISPNVILRPLYQEAILPNIAFIGGGGELAYWLELKNVFAAADIFFPMLVLRNSFLLMEEKHVEALDKLGLSYENIFRPADALVKDYVRKHSSESLSLSDEVNDVGELYTRISSRAGHIDSSLVGHVQNLRAKALKKIETLEKKMLKAERRKYDAAERQITYVKSQLFPAGTLQERKDNIMYWYAKFGKYILDVLYENSQPISETFTVLSQNKLQ